MTTALTHRMVLIGRPSGTEGTPAVRGHAGMHLGSKASAEKLSAGICATCGYGPTPRQQARLDSGKTVNHRATPAAAFVPRR
jgi:hypothetical protein